MLLKQKTKFRERFDDYNSAYGPKEKSVTVAFP